jgi:hypothetical protein
METSVAAIDSDVHGAAASGALVDAVNADRAFDSFQNISPEEAMAQQPDVTKMGGLVGGMSIYFGYSEKEVSLILATACTSAVTVICILLLLTCLTRYLAAGKATLREMEEASNSINKPETATTQIREPTKNRASKPARSSSGDVEDEDLSSSSGDTSTDDSDDTDDTDDTDESDDSDDSDDSSEDEDEEEVDEDDLWVYNDNAHLAHMRAFGPKIVVFSGGTAFNR